MIDRRLLKRLLDRLNGLIEPLRLPRQRQTDEWFDLLSGAPDGISAEEEHRRDGLLRALSEPERILAPVACLNTLRAPAFESLMVQVFGRRVRCVDVATGDLILCRRYRGRLYFQKIISESDPRRPHHE